MGQYRKIHVVMYKKNLILLSTSIIWGFNFIAQSISMKSIGPGFFLFLRFMIAGFVMLIVVLIRNKKDNDLSYIKYGIIYAVILAIASYCQQKGLITISPGKSGFISALYIVFVPLLTLIVDRRKKSSLKLWIAVTMALFGLYLLTYKGDRLFEVGDILTVLSAFIFAIQILFLDKYAPNMDPYKFNCVAFFATGIFGLLMALAGKEVLAFTNVKDCLIPVVYTGVIGTCVAYLGQTIGQIDNDPTIASLVMSLESVFAALFGYLVLHSALSTKELIGSAIIFIAIIFVQIPDKKKKQ